jgi:hypothetical protein
VIELASTAVGAIKLLEYRDALHLNYISPQLVSAPSGRKPTAMPVIRTTNAVPQATLSEHQTAAERGAGRGEKSDAVLIGNSEFIVR